MNSSPTPLNDHLNYLKLSFLKEQHESMAKEAASRGWTHLDYLSRLIEGEFQRRADNRVRARIQAARFPVIKTLEQYRWDWPKKINRTQVQNLFRLNFIKEKANIIFLGGVGLGKSHLASALGYQACLEGHSVLFATAVNLINTLAAAHAAHRLQLELKKYLIPSVLVLDEVGYLPIDKQGSDLLFQVISERYERGSIILTTNKAFKNWPSIFNNDSTMTSAVLDRLLHHADTVLIEGKSYRMKDHIET
jgi:DNA replication protein DnaC